MEIEKYREIVKSILQQYSEDDGDDSEIETQTAIDIQSDRYRTHLRSLRAGIKLALASEPG